MLTAASAGVGAAARRVVADGGERRWPRSAPRQQQAGGPPHAAGVRSAARRAAVAALAARDHAAQASGLAPSWVVFSRRPGEFPSFASSSIARDSRGRWYDGSMAARRSAEVRRSRAGCSWSGCRWRDRSVAAGVRGQPRGVHLHRRRADRDPAEPDRPRVLRAADPAAAGRVPRLRPVRRRVRRPRRAGRHRLADQVQASGIGGRGRVRAPGRARTRRRPREAAIDICRPGSTTTACEQVNVRKLGDEAIDQDPLDSTSRAYPGEAVGIAQGVC